MTREKYIAEINRLIPKAEAAANTRVKKEHYDSHEVYSACWNTVYHGEMSRLAHDAGLRRNSRERL